MNIALRRGRRVSGPAIVILLEIECAPRVYNTSRNEGELFRLLHWFDAHPEFYGLLARARELAQEPPAA